MPTTLRKEATEVAFNNNKAWLFKMNLREVRDIFSRPSASRKDGISSEANRPIIPYHRTAIEKYMVDNPNWAFETITLAVPQGSVQQASKLIQFDQDTISVLDGQHRLNAIVTLIQHMEEAAPSDRTNRVQNRINALLRDELPFLMYEVQSPEHQHELFTLFAKRHEYDPTRPRHRPPMLAGEAFQEAPPEQELGDEPGDEHGAHQDHEEPPSLHAEKQPAPRAKLSVTGIRGLAANLIGPKSANRQQDPFEQAAQAASRRSRLLLSHLNREGEEGPKASSFLSQNHIREIATTIQLGIGRTANNEDRQACSQPTNQAALQDRIVDFFDNFLGTCLPNYELVLDQTDFDERIISSRSQSYALEPQTIRLVANTWARWTIDYGLDSEILAPHIGGLKMVKADPLNDIEAAFGLVQGQRKSFQPPRHPNWERATAAIIEQALP